MRYLKKEGNVDLDYSRRIVTVLSKGIVLTKGHKAIMFIGLGNSVLMFLIALAISIAAIIAKAELEGDLLTMVVGLYVIGAFSAGMLGKIIFSNMKTEKYISKIIESTELYRARTRQMDTRKISLFSEAVKVEVCFNCDGKEIRRVSGDGKQTNTIYQKILKQYANAEIDILYSKIFDDVIILKNKS